MAGDYSSQNFTALGCGHVDLCHYWGFILYRLFQFPELPFVRFTVIGVVFVYFLGFKIVPVMSVGGTHVNYGVF